MSPIALYPLRFEPIYQYRLWGGRRLAGLLNAPLPGEGPIGEAWLLSDRDDHQSRIADGPLKGRTISQLLDQFPEQVMGKLAGRFRRFPLLLKFLDAREMLSVQVHPADTHAGPLPAGETGKTEAWVVLETGLKSRIYAGLKPGTTEAGLRKSLTNGGVASQLAGFTPKPGDAVFLPAGTVHTLGGDIVVFEVQQNSDVTYRLYDWDHIDAKTGELRALQVDQALACVDFAQGIAGLVAPVVERKTPVERERLFHCRTLLVVAHARRIAVSRGLRACAACVGMYRWFGASRVRRKPLMPPKKATSFCCLLLSGCVRFSREAQ